MAVFFNPFFVSLLSLNFNKAQSWIVLSLTYQIIVLMVHTALFASM